MAAAARRNPPRSLTDDQRIQTLNQIRQLIFTAPEPIRARFLGRYHKGLVAELAGLRPRNGMKDPVRYVTLVTLRDLAPPHRQTR